jgi:hypothetical protein
LQSNAQVAQELEITKQEIDGECGVDLGQHGVFRVADEGLDLQVLLDEMGAYFIFNDTPPLKQGQIREFTITPTEEHPNFPGVNFIYGTSRVVRIDFPKTGEHDIGVALEFVSAKFFDFLIKSS